jgi:hypothetical protein
MDLWHLVLISSDQGYAIGLANHRCGFKQRFAYDQEIEMKFCPASPRPTPLRR